MRLNFSRGASTWAAALTLGLVAAACDGGSDPATPPPPTPTVTIQSVVVSAAADSVRSGESVQLSATVTDSNNQVVANPTIAWSSSNASVASVDSNGIVSGAGEGTATITATVSGVAGTASMKVFIGSFEPTSNATLSGAVEFTDVNIPAGVTVTVAGDLVLTSRNSVVIDGDVVGDCVGIEIASAGDVNITGTVSGACSSGTLPGTSDGVVRILAGGTWTLDDADIVSGGGIQVSNLAADLAAAAAPTGWLSAALSGETRAGDCHFKNSRFTGGFTSPDPRGGTVELSPDLWLTCDGEAFVEGGVLTAGSGKDGTSISAVTQAQGGDGRSSGTVQVTGSSVTVWKKAFTVKGGNGGNGGAAVATGDAATRNAAAQGGHGGNAWLPQFKATGAGGGVFVGADAMLRIEAGTPGTGGDALATGHDGADATGTTAAQDGGFGFALGGFGGEVGVGDGTGVLMTEMFVGSTVTVLSGATFVNPPSLAKGGEATGVGGKGGNGGIGSFNGATGGDIRAIGGTGGRFHVDIPGGANVRQAANGGAVRLEGGNGGIGYNGCIVGGLSAGGSGGAGGVLQGDPGADGMGGAITQKLTLDHAGNGGSGGDGLTGGAGGAAGQDVSSAPAQNRVVANGPNATPGTPGGLCETAMATDVRVKDDSANHEPTLRLTAVLNAVSLVLLVNNAVVLNATAGLFPLTGTLGADLALNLATTGTLAGFSNILVTLVGVLVINELNRVVGFSGVLTAGANGGLFGVPAIYDIDATLPSASEGIDPATLGITPEQLEAALASGKVIRQTRGETR